MLSKILSRTERIPETDCLIFKGSKDDNGYGMVFYQNRSRRAHRVVLSVLTGEPIDTTLVAMHTCDTPSCVNPEHLRWGTKGENNRDRHTKGRNGDFKGENNPSAKLNSTEVQIIRTRPASISKMSDMFGVSKTHIKRILRGDCWNEQEAPRL